MTGTWRPARRRRMPSRRPTVDGTSMSGTIVFNQEPLANWAAVVLTAVGPDGRRYVLAATGPEQTEFFGTVWNWIAALTR